MTKTVLVFMLFLIFGKHFKKLKQNVNNELLFFSKRLRTL